MMHLSLFIFANTKAASKWRRILCLCRAGRSRPDFARYGLGHNPCIETTRTLSSLLRRGPKRSNAQVELLVSVLPHRCNRIEREYSVVIDHGPIRVRKLPIGGCGWL